MADEKERHTLEFATLGAAAYQASLNSVGSLAAQTGRQISGLTSMLNPLNSAMGVLGSLGVALSVKGLTHISADFENVQAQMAGTLTALGYVADNDFAKGLEQADSVMASIYASAAKLPGEAEDYISVFTQNLPQVQSSIGGTLQNMAAFTNKYTAVTSALKIHAGEASMGLGRLLSDGQGQANREMQVWRKLLPFMKQVEGQAQITERSFNKMTSPERANLLREALVKLDPMVEHMGDSWGAVTGAMATGLRDVVRIGGAPMFESMKKSMGGIAGLILDNTGQLSTFGNIAARVGETFASRVAGGIDAATASFKVFADRLPETIERIANSPQLEMLQNVADDITQSFGGAMMGAFGGGTVGQSLANFAAQAEVVGILMYETFVPVLSLIGTVGGAVIEGFGMLWNAATRAGGWLEKLTPVIGWVRDSFIGLVTSLADFITPFLRFLIPIIDSVVIPAFQYLGMAIASVLDALKTMVTWLGDTFGAAADFWFGAGQGDRGTGKQVDQGGTFADTLLHLLDPFKKLGGEGGAEGGGAHSLEGAAARNTPAGRKGANVVQDFRGSRFTIQQKFEDAYDPDRVAVAFATDVGRIGEQRLQSGFEPLYGAS